MKCNQCGMSSAGLEKTNVCPNCERDHNVTPELQAAGSTSPPNTLHDKLYQVLIDEGVTSDVAIQTVTHLLMNVCRFDLDNNDEPMFNILTPNPALGARSQDGRIEILINIFDPELEQAIVESKSEEKH